MCAQSPDTIRKIMLTASDLGMTQKGDKLIYQWPKTFLIKT